MIYGHFFLILNAVTHGCIFLLLQIAIFAIINTLRNIQHKIDISN